MGTIALGTPGLIGKFVNLLREISSTLVGPEGITNGTRVRLLHVTPSTKAKLATIIITVFVLFTSLLVWKHPWYSWDILLYTGCAMSLQSTNTQFIHDETYRLARLDLSKESYRAMQTATLSINQQYFDDLETNSEHFEQQLPLCWVKPLYVVVLSTFLSIGIHPIPGAVLISCLASTALSIIVYKWLKSYLSALPAALSTIVIMILAGIFEFGGITTPDMLSAVFVLFAFYRLATGRGHFWSLVSLFVSMLVRIDNFVLLAIFIAYVATIAPKRLALPQALCWLVGAGITLITIMSEAKYYGWQVHFYHSFIQKLTDPAHFTGHVTVSQYLITLASALRLKPPCNIGEFFLAFAISAVLLSKLAAIKGDVLFHIMGIACLIGVYHFLLFPELVPRYFMPYYLIAGVLFVNRLNAARLSLGRISESSSYRTSTDKSINMTAGVPA